VASAELQSFEVAFPHRTKDESHTTTSILLSSPSLLARQLFMRRSVHEPLLGYLKVRTVPRFEGACVPCVSLYSENRGFLGERDAVT
jgi:hypothetical protein